MLFVCRLFFKQRKLLLYLAIADGRMPSIHLLPPEVIAEIFIHLQSLSGIEQLPFIQTFVNAPWLLMHVCHRWRSITASLPVLWNHFTVNLGTAALSRVDVLNAYIGYSGTHRPLTIQLVMNRVSPVGDRLFRRLMVESRRWLNIAIVGQSRFLSRFQVVRGCIPKLSLLRLNVSGKPPDYRCDAFQIAPALTEVYTQDLAQHIDLPWPQLTRLFSQEYDVDQHIGVLRHLETIETCTLRVRDCSTPALVLDLETIAGITLAHLTSFTVNDPNALHYLTLPSLVDITISQSSSDSESRILNSLSLLLRRSDCRLEKLSIRSSSQEDWESLATLPQLTSLRDLDITSRMFPSTFLETLAADKKCLAPLTSLKIRANYTKHFDPQDARSFIENRLDSPLALMEIMLGIDAYVDGEWPWFRRDSLLGWARYMV